MKNYCCFLKTHYLSQIEILKLMILKDDNIDVDF